MKTEEVRRDEQILSAFEHSKLEYHPNAAEAYFDLGNTFHCRKSYAQAIACYQKALQHKPDFTEAHYNLGVVLQEQNKLAQAIFYYQKALKLKSDFVEAYYNMGNAFQELGNDDQAVSCYQKVLELKPDHASAHYNLAKSLLDRGDPEAAVNHYRQAIKFKPDYAKAYHNLGIALRDLGQIDAAIDNYRQALRIKPDYVSAMVNLGEALRANFQLDDAIETFQQAIKIAPDSAESYCNLGHALKDQAQFDAALSNCQHAIRLKPDFAEAHFNCAMAHLLRGNFIQGWQEYEWRFQKANWKNLYPYRYNGPRWDGSDCPHKTIFVHDEQGLGDTLQFVRYLPMLKSRCGNIIFETRKSLISLFRCLPGIDELVPRPRQAPVAEDWDFFIPLLSLPGIFGTTLENIPTQVPYLFANTDKVALWKTRLAETGLKVGLVWAGTNMDPQRSCHPKWFKPLSDIPGIHLYGLQKGIPARQIEVEGLPEGMTMTNFGREFEDFSDTAAVIENLDLVISIDTSVAHLAGAMGKPVWVLLPHIPDWRWFLDREDSPWYPTMRLFRQNTRGNWEEVLKRVARQLQALGSIQNNRQMWPPTLNQAEKYYNLANEFYNQKNFQQAIAFYEKAIEIRDDFFEAYFNLGKIYQDQDKLEQAVACYQKVLQINPDFFQAYFNMGIALHAQGDLEQAMSCYQK
ncbi:MAG: tetratricopeptide repeat protein, partial [Planctomycetota bacterium]